jgi:hypothetical protein
MKVNQVSNIVTAALLLGSVSVFAAGPISMKIGETREIEGQVISCNADIETLIDGRSAGFKGINYNAKPILAVSMREVISLIRAKPYPAASLDEDILDFAKERAKALCLALGYTDRVSFGLNWHYQVTAVSIEVKNGKVGDVIERNEFQSGYSSEVFRGTASPRTFKDLRCGVN